jgi:hypothetical protein
LLGDGEKFAGEIRHAGSLNSVTKVLKGGDTPLTSSPASGTPKARGKRKFRFPS